MKGRGIMGLLNIFRKNRPEAIAARDLYESIVLQARQPHYYSEWQVPDTPDGRFDMVALFAWLVLRRLRAESQDTKSIAQALYDLMFADMDQNLREMGVGDIGVSHRIKKMAKAFHGRIAAYDSGLAEADDGHLADALARNVYRKTEPSSASCLSLAAHVRAQDAALNKLDIAPLLTGSVTFLAPESGS